MSDASASAESTLADLLSLWQRSRAEGRERTPEDLCQDHPALLPQLHKRIAALKQMDRLIAEKPEVSTLDTVPFSRSDAALPDVPVIPGYEILSELGRGGMGVVYKARQISLNRLVALKMILAGSHAGGQALARFFREAETIARLKHPHIVQVHEFGSHEGKPFFSLEYLEGGSLAAKLVGEPQPPTQAAHTVELLALAVQEAHAQGIVHRDLKPGNVLLSADGVPKLTDFGVAKQLDSGMTATGQILGTPSYMAPEQAEGDGKAVGPAADIYALGVILYELLTGRPPFKGASARHTLQMVMDMEPVPPRQLQPKVPRDLETICLKCLHKDSGRRYSSARMLADDLHRFRNGEPIQARPIGRIERGWRWCGRNRLAASLAAMLSLVVVTSIVALTGLWLRAERERDQAEAQRQRAEEQKRETEKQAAIALAVNEFLQKDLLGQADIGQQLLGPREQRDPDVKVRTLLDRAARSIEDKFKDQPLTEAAIQLTIGNAYRALARYPESERHLQHSQRLRTAKLGANHPDTLKCKNDLAALYYTLGKYDRAEPLYKEVLHGLTAQSRTDEPDFLMSKHNLAQLYSAEGKYGLAEPLLKEVLQARTVKLGADHPDTLNTKNNLAGLYQNQGKYDRAEPLYREAIEASKAKFGADLPNTLIWKNNLAILYLDQGKPSLAEPLLKEVLQARMAKLGADHPDTLTSKNSLAVLYFHQRKYGLAEPLLKDVMQGIAAKLGADHPNTLTSKNNLAGLYKAQRKYSLAEPLFKEVVQAQSAKLGADHPSTLTSKNNLATLYRDQGRYASAESLYKDVLRTRIVKLGEDHPDTLATMIGLSLNLLRQNKYADAEPILRQCLAIRVKKQTDQFAVFDTRSMLGEALARQKKYAEAEPMLVEGYQGMKQHQDQIPTAVRPRRLSEALARLVRLYEATGQKAKAADWRKKLEEAKAGQKGTNAKSGK